VRIAAKRLSLVEVSEEASNQHEFNAGLLRTSLGLPANKVTGEIEFTYVGGQQAEPAGESCAYSLYQSRAGKPRSPEYRLYFASSQLQSLARVGDILIVIRSDDSYRLKGLIVSADSLLGNTLSSILSAEGTELDHRFRQIKAAIKSTELAHLLAEVAEPLESMASADLVQFADAEFLRRVIEDGKLPDTKAMAEQAALVVLRARVCGIDPDDELDALLTAETGLFRYLEQEIGQKALDSLAGGGRLEFDAAVDLVMSQLQSRKSRRGHSLQNHFGAILARHGIPYSSPCETENGETPDFMIPGCAQYHDSLFPPDRLRMVACKSTIKERWGQILKEAEKIPDKYVLTLDAKLTDDLVSRMVLSRLVVFLPRRIRDAAYTGRTALNQLGTVTDLLEQLHSVI
jgi:hypothetical protein